jgi:hypothetical protein
VSRVPPLGGKQMRNCVPVRHGADCAGKKRYGFSAMTRIRRIINDLNDAPSEALAVALADAVFLLEDSKEDRFSSCLSEADAILGRLRAHGFDVVLSDDAECLSNSRAIIKR